MISEQVVKKNGIPGIYLTSFVNEGNRMPEQTFYKIAKRAENSLGPELPDPEELATTILSLVFHTLLMGPSYDFVFTPFDSTFEEQYKDDKPNHIKMCIYMMMSGMFGISAERTAFHYNGNAITKVNLGKMHMLITRLLRNEELGEEPLIAYISKKFVIAVLTTQLIEQDGWQYSSCVFFTHAVEVAFMKIIMG